MSQGANVDDLEVFVRWKVALVKFRQAAETALLNGDAQVVRLQSWLEGEQLTYWQGQIRKRTEAVGRAKEAVRQKTLFKDSTGRTPSAFQEEKILQAALKALEEAETRLGATKRAIPRLQKENEAYRGSVQGLGTTLASDLPKAIAMIERMSMTLEDYVTLKNSQAGEAGDTLAGSTQVEGNMGRGGESAGNVALPAPVAPAAPAAPMAGTGTAELKGENTEKGKEGNDVAS